MTFSECKLLKENSTLRETSRICYLLQNLSFSSSQPYESHLLIHKDIYLCEKASEDTPERTCGTMTSFMSGDTVTEFGASRALGECPACTAAETAIQETCHQTDYVCYLTLAGYTGD
jgi:hypothetical protein